MLAESQKQFSYLLKLADVSPVYKENDKLLAGNYRPVRVLPTVSNTYKNFLSFEYYPTLLLPPPDTNNRLLNNLARVSNNDVAQP